MSLQKLGGIAAVVEALIYVVGFVAMATLLNPGSTEGWDRAQKLAFVLERQALFQAVMLLIYVVFGAVLVVLAAALHDRLNTASGTLMLITTPFALIWAGLVIASGMVASVGMEAVATLHAENVAEAVTAWAAIAAIQDGLGGGIEIVGGLWVLMISASSIQSGALPKPLAYLGFVVGAAGVITVIPPLGELGALFGLGQIVWFAWIGVSLMRAPGAPPLAS